MYKGSLGVYCVCELVLCGCCTGTLYLLAWREACMFTIYSHLVNFPIGLPVILQKWHLKMLKTK